MGKQEHVAEKAAVRICGPARGERFLHEKAIRVHPPLVLQEAEAKCQVMPRAVLDMLAPFFLI
eukprot:6607388-Pyramimonas_sp.AAC.1